MPNAEDPENGPVNSGAAPRGLPLYREWHGPRGTPVLLVHGYSTHRYTWRHWIPVLEENHRVLAVDLKGAGDSPKPRDEGYGPLEQSRLLHRLIVEQNLMDLTLVGHSLGGGIALLTALRLQEEEPSRLGRLVLVAGAAYPQSLPLFIALAARPWLGPLLLKAIPASFVIRAGLRRAYHSPEKITPQQVEAYARPLRTADGRRALSMMARRMVPPNLEELTERYGDLDVPTLLLWGRQDTIVPLRVGQRLQRDLPRSRLEILEGCGHMPQEELPAESLEIFRSFLDSGG